MLTERRIRDAKAESKTRFLWDAQVKNLGVRITPKGVKSYVVFYRSAGQKHLATLARVAELSLREARDRAGRQLAAIRAGEAHPLERRRRGREAPTVADGLDRFFDEYVPTRLAIGRMAPRTVQIYRGQAKLYIRPALGGQRVADVGRRDVELAVGRLPSATRNRALAFVSRLFSLFETWEWRPQQTNPVRGIDRAREDPRDRVLDAAELAELATALDRLDERFPASVAAIRVAALTGLRISEVLAIRWEHVDFASRRVTLPQTKTGRRSHHFPAAALDIMRAVPRLNEGHHVFAVDARGALTYRTVRHHFGDAVKRAGLSDVRLHDLRRTFMTNAAAAGVGTHVLRDLLGHKSTAMADRYVRSVGSPVADAREAVGSAMAAAMVGEGARD